MNRAFWLCASGVLRVVRGMVALGVILCSAVVAVVVVDTPRAFGFNQYVVETILPRGGQRGTTVEVLMYGNYLENPRELVSNRGGLRAVSFEEPEPRPAPKTGGFMMPGPNPQVLRAKLEIAPDCPAGAHFLFLRTDRFLSEAVLFFVGEMPVVNETETEVGQNDEPASAQEVARNSTVHGQILPSGKQADRDCYAVHAKKGERLSFDLEAVRLGTMHYMGENDCQLRLFGPDGKVLAKSDDTALYVQDPFLSVSAPADGRYVVEVSQPAGAIFTQLAHYLMHIGSFPRPGAVYPAGGRPGEKMEVQLLGDGSGPLRQNLMLPQGGGNPGPAEVFDFLPQDAGGRAASALPMRVSSHPNVMESEPNDGLETARTFLLPAALNGIIGSEGDVDLWRFHAEKGQAVDIRVFARTLGTPLDPKIWIRPARAEKEGEKPLLVADDAQMEERGYFSHTKIPVKGILDPAVTFVAKESGDYLLGIEDTRGLSGPVYVYRIEVQAHRDSFCVSPSRPSRPASYDWSTREVLLQVPRGGRWTTNLKVGEGLGTQFGTESFTLEAVGLPPGVRMEAPVLTPSKAWKEVPVQFIAEPGAKTGVSFIRVLAKPNSPGAEADLSCQKGLVFSNRRAGLGWLPVWMESFPLAVVEQAPFELELERPAMGLVRAGELDLHVKVRRQPGWGETVEVRLDYLPTGVEQGQPVEVAPGQTEVVLPLKAQADAPLNEWKVCVVGSTKEGNAMLGTGCRLVSSALVDLTVTEPFLMLEFQRASVRRGGSGEITAAIRQIKPFSGRARASLVGLPAGVKLCEPFPEITASDKTCVFQIEANAEALLGQYKQIQAEVSVPEGGQMVRQQTGSGVLRVDPARPASN